jgi:hypothetical protein
MQDRKVLAAKKLQEKNAMDRKILDKAESEMADERKKQSALKHKMLQ